MASAKYYVWAADGRPYRLMRPAAALQRVLRGHGLTVYDYPDDDHLKDDPAQDHTPFAATGWPTVSAYGVGHAVDIMPRGDGAAGRAENAAVARKLIADRNAAVPGVMWIKYLNWTDERGICRQERWMPNHTTRGSTDKGHVHVSGRSDCDNDTRADDYDPLGGEDMDSNQAQQLTNLHEWVKNFLQGHVTGSWPHSGGVLPTLVPNAKLNTIDTTTAGLATGGVTQDMVTAGLKAALTDPAVLAVLRPVLVDAATEGAEKAEDS